MSEYEIVNNYFMFEELDSDSIGTTYRVGEIINRKAEKHWLLTEVYPSLSDDPNIWKRMTILMEGIRKSNIPGLFCPEKIIDEGERALLIYPFIKGKSLETVLEDAFREGNHIEIELLLSIALGIADALDTGSTIIINKQKSFHGILTPDNIFIDFDGKIFLKNYGIFPYLKDTPQLLSKTTEKFAKMLAPEFTRDGNMMPQSDIYYLGNIIHRLLTGKYFGYSPTEDFESQLSGIELTEFLFTGEDDLSSTLIDLFRRTLNPDPGKRFASIKEFKDYISRHFRIEELSSATFIIAYFINQLYLKTTEEEDRRLKEELTTILPEEKAEVKEALPVDRRKYDDHMIEDILIELEQQKRSRVKIVVPLIVLIVLILAGSTYIIINQQIQAKKQQQIQIARAQELERRMVEMRGELSSEYQRRLKVIEQQATSTEEEKKDREKEIEELKKWRLEQERRTLERFEAQKQALKLSQKQPTPKKPEEKKQEEIPQAKGPETQQPTETTETTETTAQPQPTEIKPAEKIAEPPVKKEDVQIAKTPDIMPLDTVTFTPSKLSGKRKAEASEFTLSEDTLGKYAGQTLAIKSDILINERGFVEDIKIKENIPGDLQSKVTEVLKAWTYIPAEKDKTRVKVWLPVELLVVFAGTPAAQVKPEAGDEGNVVALDSVTYEPSKLSETRSVKAEELGLSKAITQTYKGKTLTVEAEILISEHGNVLKVKMKSKLPPEFDSKATEILKTWKYVGAELNKNKVKVWLPVDLKVVFKGPPVTTPAPTPPVKKVEPEIIDESNLVPLDSVSYEPSKLSGQRRVKADELGLPKTIIQKYKGKTSTVNATILINEHGYVLKVKIEGNLPNEIVSKITEILKTWKYIAAEKDKKKVKVWYPVRLVINF